MEEAFLLSLSKLVEKSQDPDLDFYSTDVYITRIRHELMPMHDTSFVCRNCNFKNNYAMSIARGIGERIAWL